MARLLLAFFTYFTSGFYWDFTGYSITLTGKKMQKNKWKGIYHWHLVYDSPLAQLNYAELLEMAMERETYHWLQYHLACK